MVKQTAGRDSLGTFAPKFAALNDDVLFGEVWAREGQLSLKMRSILTISALVSKGQLDSSFQFHVANARNNGVTRGEMAEILTHLAFYAGWPNAWAAFRIAVEVYRDDDGADGGLFGIGALNDAYAQYFVGKSYLKPLTDPKETVFMANVTFEPGCRNNWHIHCAEQGGGQILLCTGGRGWYQEQGKDARELFPGDTVTIPAGVKHWHGAAKDCWFSHVAVECPGKGTTTEWCEPVGAEDYDALP
ncbi:MAG: cupin domain-containing protein [Anaerotignum sp.]|jgi:4-carboxymuconolactone decarboxylase|nr:cupin domain-containing protein [Anaerotignum sp.]